MLKQENRKLKLLFLTGSFGTGGKERQIIELIKNIQDKYENYLLVKNVKTFYLSNNHLNIKEIIDLNKNAFDFETLFRLSDAITRINPDFVISFSTILSHMSLFLQLNNCFNRQLYKLINISIRNAPEKKSFLQVLEAFLYDFYPVVVSNSEAGLKSYNQFKKNGRFVLPNIIDLDRFPIDSKNSLRKKAKLVEDGFIITMLSRFDDVKDYDSLISIAELCIKKDSNIYFYLVGSGKNLNRIKDLILTKNLDKNIISLGERVDSEIILAASNLSILLSTNGESLSNSVLESLACKVPVIASNNKGNSQIIKNGINGFLVNNDKFNKISDLILSLKKDHNLMNKLSEETQVDIISNYSKETVIKKFNEVIEFASS